MEFIETNTFTKFAEKYISHKALANIQEVLNVSPGLGKILLGSGGLRKMRWRSAAKGKRGGIRIIYYWYAEKDLIYLLYAYDKAKQEDLTAPEINALSNLIKEMISYG